MADKQHQQQNTSTYVGVGILDSGAIDVPGSSYAPVSVSSSSCSTRPSYYKQEISQTPICHIHTPTSYNQALPELWQTPTPSGKWDQDTQILSPTGEKMINVAAVPITNMSTPNRVISSTLTYEVIASLKRDVKKIFAKYAISLDTPEQIKLVCIRNSVLTTLTTDYWELTHLSGTKKC